MGGMRVTASCRRACLTLGAFAVLAGGFQAGASCGPVLDDILNCIVLDGRTASRDEARHCGIEPTRPVGQTFVTGDGVGKVFRIAVWQAFWHETWQADEVLVMTLWDSPYKRTAYGRCGIPYARRMWEGAVPMFTLDARVEPSRRYYFELTVEVQPLRPATLPRGWVLSGKRPGFADGDGKLDGVGIAKDDYADGCAYVGGEAQDFDLWFQVHARKHRDRDGLYREAFDRFDLSYPPLRPLREAVEARDWERATAALVRHFEGRGDLVPPDRQPPRYDPEYDTREADLACEHEVLLADGTTVDLGPEWNHFALWPERGGVGLTRSGLRKALAAAYEHTGNEKYARAFDDMLAHLFVQCPSPIRAGAYGPDGTIPAALPPGIAGGPMWSGLSIGARMGHGFAYYARLVDSPCFTPDVRAAFIINLGEMAEVLERMKGGGNWETQMADSLFDFGLTYPEFRGAKARVEQGLATLVRNALSTVHADGTLQEPSINYHTLVMGRYASVIERARALKLAVPDEMVKLTERMYEFVMYSALPDGMLPLWGDANPPMSTNTLAEGAELFRRQDFRFAASGGKEGTPPRLTSVGFPDGGFYYMRTGWRPDSDYMAIRCGPYGSHGHQDTLSLIACARGRLALIDPGVYTYGTPECQELTETRSHNTVTVDDRNAAAGKADGWVTSERFDFFAGHSEGYRGLTDVHHHRRVWFLKPFEGHPALWVVLDDVTGAGEHEAVLRYRFAPLAAHHDAEDLRAWTTGKGGNLLVAVLERGRARMEPGDGIAAAGWEKLTRVPVASFRERGQLPIAFTSVLVPFEGSAPAACDGTLIAVRPESEGARAVWATSGDEAALVVAGGLNAFEAAPTELAFALPDGRPTAVRAAGGALRFVRQADRWQARNLHGVRVQSVSLGGQALFSAGQAKDSIDLSLGGSQ
jgi:hypothetical protein